MVNDGTLMPKRFSVGGVQPVSWKCAHCGNPDIGFAHRPAVMVDVGSPKQPFILPLCLPCQELLEGKARYKMLTRKAA